MGNGKKTGTRGSPIAGPIMIGPPPQKSPGGKRRCPFKCSYKCIEPAPRKIFCSTDELRGRFRKAVGRFFIRSAVNPGEVDPGFWDDKNRLLTLLLRGALHPLNRRGFRPALCGRSGQGEPMHMQLYSPEEMSCYLEGTNISARIASMDKRWVSALPGGEPIGLADSQVGLLCAMAALELGPMKMESPSLQILIEDGGPQAMFGIAHMVAEPTVDYYAREKFIFALEEIASCTSVDANDRRLVEIYNSGLAARLSRFAIPTPECIKDAIKYPAEPGRARGRIGNEDNLVGMLFLATEALIRACMEISSRLQDTYTKDSVEGPAYWDETISLLSNLDTALRSLLKNEKIAGMLAECARSDKEIDSGSPELGALRGAIKLREGELLPGSVRDIRRFFGWESEEGAGLKGDGGEGRRGDYRAEESIMLPPEAT